MDCEKTIKAMSLKEKVALCSGKNEWYTKDFPKYGIPSVMMSDGPNGLRKLLREGDILGIIKSDTATCFPVESAVACSFDRDLIGRMGAAIAEEAGAAGVSLLLGPGVNMKRNPLCGRNFEYLSEDPYLAGKLGAAYITAVQEKGIGACLKHFACNSQEYFRMVSDSIIDERTLREIYLTAFEYAVKEGKPQAVMCAYNKVNGVFCSDNKYLLSDILRSEWSFNGFVVTDWGAIHDRSESFKAGCDIVMPGGNAYGEKDALENVKNGTLSEKSIDQSATRILNFASRAHETLKDKKFTVDYEQQHELARRIAEGSAVLLKNDDNMLPCNTNEIVLVGHMADNFRYQGYGSSRINPKKFDTVFSLLPDVRYAPGYDEEGNTTDEMVAQAVTLAKTAKKVIVIAGLPDIAEVEGIDRADMKMPDGQNRVIFEVSTANPNIAVVLCCGCAVETPWADHVKSILYMGLSGQAGAGALVNILAGKVNPSGRLAETWPMRYEDCPSSTFFSNGMRNAEYREGIYIGYRYYEKAGKSVRFPFGSGLSYTEFSYNGLRIEENKIYITVTNIGGRFGGDAVLMYVHAPQSTIHRPLRELKGFEKVYLSPGESKEISFEIDERTFRVWNDGWKIYAGEYVIQIGACKASIQVNGEAYQWRADQGWYQSLQGVADRDDWIKILDRIPQDIPKRPYTIDSTVEEIAKNSLPIRLLYKYFEKMQAKASGRGTVNYKVAMKGAGESPLRNVQNSFMLKGHFAQAIADFGNKKFLKGIWHLIH